MMSGNDDVVMEIISRLPTKSLCRFKCVSKPWSSFISHVSSRRKILLPVSGFLVFTFGHSSCRRDYFSIVPDRRDEDRRVFESRLINLPYRDSLTLIHSCNGLILFFRSNGENRLYYVWNPATDEFPALPDPPPPGPHFYSQTYCFLAFDPRRNPHYKLVQFCDSNSERVTVAIYSSMTGSWARRRISCPESLEDFRSRSVFHDGALHMLKTTHLLRFNTTETTFDLINLPEVRTEDVWWVTPWIGESRVNLYYAPNSVMMQQLRIYMLDGESSLNWILAHTLDREFLHRHPFVSNPSACFQLVAFNPESEVIFLKFNDKILSYHPSNGKLEETCKLSEYEAMFDWTRLLSVIPCLESINPPGGKFINFN